MKIEFDNMILVERIEKDWWFAVGLSFDLSSWEDYYQAHIQLGIFVFGLKVWKNKGE
jgi:hypothetical protein